MKATTAGDIQMGAPIQFHNISVVPVLTSRRGPFQKYTLLESGLEAKTIQVRELKGNSGAAQVNSVEVRNRGKEPVYLLGGEMILGGKQDRVIARDTVIAASGKWVEVAVFCVEAGRWRGQNMKFSAGKAMVDVSVRRAAMSGSQSEVWKEVDKKNVLHGTQSATQTYRRTIQNGEVRKKVRPYVQELKSRLPGNPMLAGLVFGVNGKIHVADIFGNPVLFGDLSEKLLSAYVLEALSHQVVPGSKPVSTDAAEQFVGRGRKARSKKVIKSGRARSYRKEADDLIGAETVDEKSGKTLRETYIGK
ncbi:MAG: hypothetical protein MJE77_17200 [Proteobacteria bacterium]|nr:hypothetical protein [Pseudomonadota bacterium]